MKLTLGYSPCPNDTFLFDALVHGRIKTPGFEVEVVLDDVEALNQKAVRGELQLTKLSYAAFTQVMNKYGLLHAGSALGHNCGPLLIARAPMSAEELTTARVAIPGKLTTANFLLGIAYPEIGKRVEYVFDQIEDAVLNSEVDAGLIIHENRFTYADRGLVKIKDLGEHWEDSFGLPIPLGGIFARRDLDPELVRSVDQAISRSVRHAFDHPDDSRDYVKAHAQAMEESVMKSHIALYVNSYTESLGAAGVDAVAKLLQVSAERELYQPSGLPVFHAGATAI